MGVSFVKLPPSNTVVLPTTPLHSYLSATHYHTVEEEMNFTRILLLSLYHLQMAYGVFWNWVLTNPHQVESDSSVLNVRLDQRPIDHGDEDKFRLGHPRQPLRDTHKSHRTTTVSPTRKPTESDGLPILNKLEYNFCFSDRDCEKLNTFCDLHYGYCRPYRRSGDTCRTDYHCATGLHCMYGRCTMPPKSGREGSRCTGAEDCGEGLCCAKQHGERVCKPKLKIGDLCYVPEGGLTYSLNEMCPCDTGLVCDRTSDGVQRRAGEDWLRHWRDRSRVRCVRPNSN